MAGKIWEFFGYRATDKSSLALDAAANRVCPFLKTTCEKILSDGSPSGVCSIEQMTTKAVICCPARLYADDYRILRDVADDAFDPGYRLVPGPSALAEAQSSEETVIAVFGKKWGSELRIPKKSGRGGYWVDWVLAKIDSTGVMREFVAVEVQSIDTTGNYRIGREELLAGNRKGIKTSAGFNWENVNKRILPQLIYKGQLLQKEEFCKKGIYFICPQRVFEDLIRRLGGRGNLPEYPSQPASISLLAYDHDLSNGVVDGEIVPLSRTDALRTTVETLARAFNTVNLSDSNVYGNAIARALSGGH